jgi:hypothetical protein
MLCKQERITKVEPYNAAPYELAPEFLKLLK